MVFTRHWAMPSADTFGIKPIRGFVQKYLLRSKVSIDPFARNSRLATWRNDLNTNTAAECHMEACEFLKSLQSQGVVADLFIFDPPYSPRQISEVYQQIGKACSTKSTQNGALYKEVRDATRTPSAWLKSEKLNCQHYHSPKSKAK